MRVAVYVRCRSLKTPANWVLLRESHRKANACHAKALARYNARYREKLTSASSTWNWWGTLKESDLAVGLSISPLQSNGGALVSDTDEKLLS